MQQIEAIGLVPKSQYDISDQVVKLENHFRQNEAVIGVFNSLLEHPDLTYCRFPKVTNNKMKDTAREMLHFGVTKYPLPLKLKKAGKLSEPPVELLWMMKMD